MLVLKKIKRDELLFEYLKEQTIENCLTAVEKNGLNLQYVKKILSFTSKVLLIILLLMNK